LIRKFIALVFFGLAVSCTNDNKVRVGLQPFGDFNSKLSDTIAMAIEKNYNIRPFILKSIHIPSEAFINIKTPRYRADKLIRYLRDHKSDSLDFVVGLTNEDISVTTTDDNGNVKKPESKYKDWGVFGYGYRPGESCIVSTFRLGNISDKRFFERIKKVSLHELGHNFGLDHCESAKCVMRDAAETIKTIDNVNAELCDICKEKLK
jgi:archaemetzincin